MAKRIFTVFFVSLFSLGYLSVGFLPSGKRGLASCEDPVAAANLLPLPSGLFGEIQSEALRKSTADYYLFLTKVETQALAGRQSIRGMYGISDSISPMPLRPAFTPFNLKGSTPFATGFLWGTFGSQPNSTLSLVAPLPATVSGLLFQPSSLQGVAPSIPAAPAGSPMAGVFFPPVNGTAHGIGGVR